MSFTAGERVELHPGTDHWMRGDRYGVVLKDSRVTGVRVVRVVLDKSNKTVKLTADLVRKIGGAYGS